MTAEPCLWLNLNAVGGGTRAPSLFTSVTLTKKAQHGRTLHTESPRGISWTKPWRSCSLVMIFCATFKRSLVHTAHLPAALTFSDMRHFQLRLRQRKMSESSERRLPAEKTKKGKEGRAIRAITLNQSLCSRGRPWAGGYNLCAQQTHAAYEQTAECVTQEEGRAQTWLQGKCRAARISRMYRQQSVSERHPKMNIHPSSSH